MNDNIFYYVEPKSSKCNCCGKPIKNIYHYKDKEYGYHCFMSAIGNPIDRTTSKEKPLPTWVFELMNNYFEEYKDEYTNFEYMAVNFFNKYMSKEYNDHALWNRTVEVCGKKIPVYQQYMINEYLIMRLKQYHGIH